MRYIFTLKINLELSLPNAKFSCLKSGFKGNLKGGLMGLG